MNSGIITTTVNIYIHILSGYINQFTQWGEWLFYSFLGIAMVWLCLWRAFDHSSFQESMPSFLKEFIVIAFFYTVLVNAGPWLSSIVNTATSMGTTLTGEQVDPSSIITNGIALADKILTPAQGTGLLTNFFGAFITAGAYFVVLACFISIALDLAVTLILCSLLIAMSALFLSFAAFSFTRQIARNTLDLIVANSVKLLVLYVVIAAGNGVFKDIADSLPTTSVQTFDVYAWTIAAALLFWLVCKNIPTQIARIVSGAIQEMRGTETAALAMAAVEYAQMASPVSRVAGGIAGSATQIGGSALYSAKSHWDLSKASSQQGFSSHIKNALKGTGNDVGHAFRGHLSDHFKNLHAKMTGGISTPVSSVASRMHEQTKTRNASFSKSKSET